MNSQNEHFDTDAIRAISILEVARRLDTVKKAGVRYVTICPWHEDHHPSLSLVEGADKNYCHCFSCGKGGDVIAYAMQHEGWTFREACQWLSGEFGITLHKDSFTPRPKPRTAAKPAAPDYTYIPMKMVDELVSTESSLCRCLVHMFQAEAVEWLCEEYRLGCYSMKGLDDYTVFPSIDAQGRVCNLKIQHYETDLLSPRFSHSEGSPYWLGAIWAREGRLPANARFNPNCLFGEHLLPRYPMSKVALVESPKNALFGALAFPELLWVAAGNKGMLKRDVLQPLRKRDIIVIPDCDAVEEWAGIVGRMSDLANFTVSDFCKLKAPVGQPKFDIADYLQQQRLVPF